ncbi:META domain-containing protein [Dokdonella sp.]|uniref:META domain-containing protein n=1 Tax=Dokdonella sp. TaxID=2291710 RepID=UPI0031C0DD0F|nr:META and DUF4377 domain-containing protein [Dokdonella sp.]
MRPAILLLPLLLAACATPPTSDPVRPAAASVADSATLLTRYHWRLEQASDAGGQRIFALFARPGRPLQLDFQDGRLAISNACNRMGASYELQDGHLQLGPIMATRMACADPAVAALDTVISERLPGSRLHIADRAGAPTLVLLTPKGDRLGFVGEPTAAARFGGPGAVVFFEVAPQAVACSSAVGNCLQVRELHYDAQGLREGEPGTWHTLTSPIEGYRHQPGVREVLRVRRHGSAGRDGALVLEQVIESGSGAP